MTIFEVEIGALGGGSAGLDAYRGKAMLIVNVASQCALTPQYEGLQRLADRFGAHGLVVLGVPCNQFGEQEPGTDGEIAEFCSVNYGVTFPLTEKIEVNGPARHPLYDLLADVSDAQGYAGDIRWNFEKFLIGRDGDVVARFSPRTAPEDEAVIDAIEKALG